MIKIIDWYIIKKYLGTFIFTLGIFTVIIVIFDISEKLDDFFEHEATLGKIILIITPDLSHSILISYLP